MAGIDSIRSEVARLQVYGAADCMFPGMEEQTGTKNNRREIAIMIGALRLLVMTAVKLLQAITVEQVLQDYFFILQTMVTIG